MKIGLYITTSSAETGTEHTYSYEIEVSDKMNLGEVEGHVQTMLGVLDRQAHESVGDEDEESSTD